MADRLQVPRLDFSPGCLGSGSPPASVQRTHGVAIHAHSLMVQPPHQHVGTPWICYISTITTTRVGKSNWGSNWGSSANDTTSTGRSSS
eukprot:8209851-Prorocentrum_lima.AAC.1